MSEKVAEEVIVCGRPFLRGSCDHLSFPKVWRTRKKRRREEEEAFSSGRKHEIEKPDERGKT